jgi:hypothetical protein
MSSSLRQTIRPLETLEITAVITCTLARDDKLLSARQRRPSMAKRKKRRIGAFSRRLSLSDLNLRTNAGKFANSIKEGLEAQIGSPTAGQQILIKLVAIKVLRCEMMPSSHASPDVTYLRRLRRSRLFRQLPGKIS